MEIQSLSDTYEIMSGGNQISLMYRGGCGGRFVTRQICSKSQLENIFATVPGKKSSWIVLKNTIWELFIRRDFPLRHCTFRNVQLVQRFQAALSIYRCPQQCSGDVLHHKTEAKSRCEALDDSVTGCSVLVRAPEVWKTPSAEKGGYVNMWLHTCNNTMSTF